MRGYTLEEFGKLVGREIGVSDWIEIDQNTVDQFAACTGDNQFIHINHELARQSIFGATIAHGLLTLSILAPLQNPFTQLEGTTMTVNYGFNRIRFTTPVPVGARFRGRFVLQDLREIRPRELQLTLDAVAEIEGSEKPGVVAELILRKYF